MTGQYHWQSLSLPDEAGWVVYAPGRDKTCCEPNWKTTPKEEHTQEIHSEKFNYPHSQAGLYVM